MTIKLRLTLLFAMVITLIVAILMISLYEYASYQRRVQFNEQLFSRALIAATVALESDEMSPPALEPFRRKLAGYQLPEESIGIFDAQNQRVYSGGKHRLMITDEERAIATQNQGYSKDALDTQFIFFPYFDNDELFVIKVSAVDKAGLHSLHRLGYAMIAGFAISVGMGCAAAWWFASRAMAPIARTTRQAERISATDLHIRLDEGNGRDELSQLAQAFNAMLERLDSAFSTQKQFIANASHEMRTPLTTLEGSLDIALMQPRPAHIYKEVLENALEDTRRLRVLVNDLLLLARTEFEFPDSQLTTLRLDEIFFSVMDEIHAQYPGRGIDVQLQARDDNGQTLQIRGDSGLMRVAVENLLENALKYSDTASGGPIQVCIGGDGTSTWINITNRGTGIAASDFPHIFDPFYRGSNTHNIPGNGIGLALVQTIVQRHHGSVHIQSERYGPTTATVTLPNAPEGS